MILIEIVDLLRKIVIDCSNIDGNDFLIAPSKVPESNVEGYEIHMTGNFDDATRRYLNDLALEKKLAITQHPNSIMLYEARPSKIQPIAKQANQ